ncbi:MAG: polyphosphate polymerase domain-containing protein [Bacteroidota bacterium]
MRYERKYRIESIPIPWIEQVLRAHPAGFRPLYPQRQVNNIYFDTPALDEFYQNVSGTPQRRKHRMRWYGGTTAQLPKTVFEVKIKDNELGSKESQALGDALWTDLPAHFEQIPAMRYLPLRPVLVNSYERTYWGTANGKFRITLDWNMRFAPFSWAAPPPHLHYLPDQAVVLELKYEQEYDEEANAIFAHLPFRLTKNSKYVTGIGLVMN